MVTASNAAFSPLTGVAQLRAACLQRLVNGVFADAKPSQRSCSQPPPGLSHVGLQPPAADVTGGTGRSADPPQTHWISRGRCCGRGFSTPAHIRGETRLWWGGELQDGVPLGSCPSTLRMINSLSSSSGESPHSSSTCFEFHLPSP